MVAEMTFRKLNAPDLMEKVAEGKNTTTERMSGSPPKSFYPLFDNGSNVSINSLLWARDYRRLPTPNGYFFRALGGDSALPLISDHAMRWWHSKQ